MACSPLNLCSPMRTKWNRFHGFVGPISTTTTRWIDQERVAERTFILPGVPSDKVLVRIYIADEHGRIPAEPQQVFRKNDWTPAVPVVDLDGDGYPDLVLGYSHLDSKESLRKKSPPKRSITVSGFTSTGRELVFQKKRTVSVTWSSIWITPRTPWIGACLKISCAASSSAAISTGMAKRLCWCGTTATRSRFTFLFRERRGSARNRTCDSAARNRLMSGRPRT